MKGLYSLVALILLLPSLAFGLDLGDEEIQLHLGEGWTALDLMSERGAHFPDALGVGAYGDPNAPTQIIVLTATKVPSPILDLEAHLEESARALKDFPGIKVRQATLLEASRPLGRIEVIREGRGILRVLSLKGDPPRIVQRNLIAPSGDLLIQIFHFSWLHDPEAAPVFEALPEGLSAPPAPSSPTPEDDQDTHASGKLIERLAWGIAGALIVIVFLRLWSRARRRLDDSQGQTGQGRPASHTSHSASPGEETPRAPWEDDLGDLSDAFEPPDKD